MIAKESLQYADKLEFGGNHVPCDNPDCSNAYHYMQDVSYSILHQDRPDGSVIDLSFCSLKCLLKIEPAKEHYAVFPLD